MKTSTIIKLAVAIIALAGAGWLYKGYGGEEIPVDKLSLSPFKCSECGAVMELTDLQFAEKRRLAEMAQAQTDDTGKMGKSKSSKHVLICDSCKKVAAKPAAKCPKDGELFIDKDKFNNFNKCPKCGWSR